MQSKKNSKRIVDWQLLKERFLLLLGKLKWPVSLIVFAVIVSLYDFRNFSWFNPNWELILKYIDVLKWPVVAFIVLKAFKPHLPGLMTRMRKVAIAGSSAEFDQATSTKTSKEIKEIQESNPEVAQEKDTDEAEDLEKILTSAEAKSAYMDVYSKIFGSQLEALRLLANYENGLSKDDLEYIVEKHKSLSPSPYQNIIEFMAFLRSNILVLYEPDTQLFKLTNAGLYFLRYLNEVHLLDADRPY